MRGAIVFLIAFAIFLVATIAYPNLPPAPQIYSAAGLPATDYPVGGTIGATALILAVFNGVVYGVIIWLIFSLANMVLKPKQKQ